MSDEFDLDCKSCGQKDLPLDVVESVVGIAERAHERGRILGLRDTFADTSQRLETLRQTVAKTISTLAEDLKERGTVVLQDTDSKKVRQQKSAECTVTRANAIWLHAMAEEIRTGRKAI